MKIKIRKGDTVEVISGLFEDKGKRGEVIKVLPKDERVVVQGVNLRKKHQQQIQTRGKQLLRDILDRLNLFQKFLVTAIDDDAGTIEIQYFDGTVEELDFDSWEEMAMQAAEKNILEMQDNLTALFREKRQAAITAELLDIVGGANAL